MYVCMCVYTYIYIYIYVYPRVTRGPDVPLPHGDSAREVLRGPGGDLNALAGDSGVLGVTWMSWGLRVLGDSGF